MNKLIDFMGEKSPNNPDNITLDKLWIIAANKAANEFTYGDIINKSWLMNEFAIDMPELGSQSDFNNANFEFLQNMEGFKTYLLEYHKMFLQNVRGVGYKIMLPSHQSDYAIVRLRNNVSTEIKKAMDTLTHINESMLTQEDIRKRDENQGKIAALSAFSKKRFLK